MIFVDASFFLAYYNINDVHHEKAKTHWTDIEAGKYGQHFTSDYILNEVVGVTLRKLGKKPAIMIGRQLLESVIILNIDDHLLLEAWRIFENTQFNFNLVGCTNLVTMKILNADNIATFDKEFSEIKNIYVIK